MMRRHLYRVLGCLAACLSGIVVAQDQQASSSYWYGSIDSGAVRLRLVVRVDEQPAGLAGKMISLDQDNAEIPLEQIVVSEKTLQFKAPTVGGSYSGETKENEDEYRGNWLQRGNTMPLTLKPVAGLPKETVTAVWVGDLDVGVMKLRLQFRVLNSQFGNNGMEETIVRFDSLTQRAMGLHAEMQQEGNQTTFSVPGVSATFTGTLSDEGNRLTGTWKQGLSYPLVLEKRKAVETPPEFNRPQHPRPPFPYQFEEVSIDLPEEAITLSGTLTLPTGAGPFPAVVLISGSGPQDRDETVADHKPFLVIADHLTRHGVAVLRFDDRGAGKSTGDFSKATTFDFANDVRAAVSFLRASEQIDNSKIVLLGHSEGGLVAPLVAAGSDTIAGLILLAPPAVPGRQIVDAQSRWLWESLEGKESTRAARDDAIRTAIMAVQDESPDASPSEVVKRGIDRYLKTVPEADRDKAMPSQAEREQLEKMVSPWFLLFFKYDPLPKLKELTCPVLALFGEKDIQVSVEQNHKPLVDALSSKNHTDVTVKVMPGLNHLFQKAETGSPAEYAKIE